MAVTTVNKVRVVESANASVGEDSYDVMYHVTVDDKDTPLSEVLGASGVPQIGAEFSEIPYNYCVDQKAELIGSTRLKWNVTVTFSNKPTTKYSWGTKTRRLTLVEDKGTREPITNTAGEPFSPAMTTDVHMLTCRIEREEPTGNGLNGTFTPNNIVDFINTVNSDQIELDVLGAPYTLPAYSGLMEGMTASWNQSKQVWNVTYDITIRKEDPYWNNSDVENNAWKRRIMDVGLRELDVDTGKLKPIHDYIAGSPTTKPVRLDGNGAAIRETTSQDPTNLTATVWLGFQEFDESPWHTLAL